MDHNEGSSDNSLIESDIESLDSFIYLDFEDLDVTEYALPSSKLPSLDEALSCADDIDLLDEENSILQHQQKLNDKTDSAACALQVEILQGVSQQLLQAEERSAAGAATALSLGPNDKLTVGTAHGHILSFQEQILKWVCNNNTEYGAVSCLSYNEGGDRILVGYARGLICEYESESGAALRRVTLGGELWGILRVTWAGPCGVALDTGGSVWLMRFTRPLGVRSCRSSCLFSGARGEVVSMAGRDSRVLALATLARVVVVAGGRAAALSLEGPPHTLPLLTWLQTDDYLLVCARHHTLQWVAVHVTSVSVTLRNVRKFTLNTTPLWLGWIGGSLAIFDIDEKLRLWGSDYDNPVDVSHVEPVYASAFFKGVWTEGRVSAGLSAAGGGALSGVSSRGWRAAVLGRRGVAAVSSRPPAVRAAALLPRRPAAALALLNETHQRDTAADALNQLLERPQLLAQPDVIKQLIRLCHKFHLREELWGDVWERCDSGALSEALALALIRGACPLPPTPDVAQQLIERVYRVDPTLVERLLATLPFDTIDPHRAMKFAVEKRLWRAVGTVAGTMGGHGGALRELTAWSMSMVGSPETGSALALVAADGLAGRSVSGDTLPQHDRFAASHHTLTALLTPTEIEGVEGGISPLGATVRANAQAAISVVEHAWPHPPLVGPMGKFHRQTVIKELLEHAQHLASGEDRVSIVEAVSRLTGGSGGSVSSGVWAVLEGVQSERADLLLSALAPLSAAHRPRVALRAAALAHSHHLVLDAFMQLQTRGDHTRTDIDHLLDYLHRHRHDPLLAPHLDAHLDTLLPLSPRRLAAVLDANAPHLIRVCMARPDINAVRVGDYLLENGTLRGDLASMHLRNVCTVTPDDVKSFILANPGVVRPEDSVKIIEELGPQNVVPYCLESVGDFEGALSAWTELLSRCTDDNVKAELVREACELCTRAGPALPRGAVCDMWTRLLEYKETLPRSALLEAFSHVPLERAVGAAGADTALEAVRAARAQLTVWRATSRAQRAGLGAAGAAARRRALRAAAAREARCASCARPLEWGGVPVRVWPCVHGALSTHVSCPPAAACRLCVRLPRDTHLTLPPNKPAHTQTLQIQHELLLVAPPRPDLEGLV